MCSQKTHHSPKEEWDRPKIASVSVGQEVEEKK
jgi:hypothetical protein